ncbi:MULTISPECIES: lipase [unclassified Frankia]|nr:MULTISPECIES: lipase [unclassified Frankia]
MLTVARCVAVGYPEGKGRRVARRRYFHLLSALAIAGLAVACSGAGGTESGAGRSPALARELAEAAVAAPDASRLPILFVHGSLGSGSLFETPAQRFTANGYPVDYVEAFDYDASSSANSVEEVLPDLDAKIASILKATGAKKLDLVAHLEGAALSERYLTSSSDRANRVAHYVTVGGSLAGRPPAGVPTLAVWGENDPTRRVEGAVNVRFVDQDRAQLLTSTATFREMYRFLTGTTPHTTDVVPKQGPIEISGRALRYPMNVGVRDARLEVHRVDPRTGRRGANSLKGYFHLSGDGSWGPFRGDGASTYEFVIVRGGEPDHHFYYQPFRRDDHLVRLLTSQPGQEIGGGMETGPGHTDLVVERPLEWWGDQGNADDVLSIDGKNVLNAADAPRSKLALGVYLFDRNSDGVTHLTMPIPAYFGIGFITGVDVFIPAGERSVEVAMTPRGKTAHRSVLQVPAWPSDRHRVTLHFTGEG